DYALTFPTEVQYIWSSKFRWSTFLYVLCRYALLANVLYLLDIAGKLTENCNTWYQFIGALSVLGRAAIIVVFTGRTWAVWGKNRIVLAYMSILGATCVALDITHVPGLRCTGGSSIPINFDLIANDLLSILMVVFEFSSAILNTIRCVQAFKAHKQSFKEQKDGFQYLLFEQGSSIVSLFTTAAVILNFSGFFQRLLNALTLPLSGLLTARLLLHIREWEHSHSPAANSNHEAEGTNFSFRAATNFISTTMGSDFGSDPVARQNARDVEELSQHGLGESDTSGGLDSRENESLGDDSNISSSNWNPDLESAVVVSSVREGKKPARV
ncbi:hypothetical protein BT96DRAFT_811154, partial [Gymnopus androsaceus JB14]